MNWRGILDPDRDWRSPDKIEHLGGGALCAVVFALCGAPWWLTLLLVLLVGFTYELGQWDTARHFAACFEHGITYDGDPKNARLLPGYGVGLMDLGFDVLGGVLVLIIRGIIRA